MSESGFDTGRVLSGATSFLEKGAEPSFFFLIGSAFFLLDTCLVLFYDKNILGFSREEISIANALIFISLLSFLISMFFPAARIILSDNCFTRYIYAHIYIPIMEWWYDYDSSYGDYTYDFLTAEIRAIVRKDEFTLKRLNDRRDSVRRVR